MLGLVDRAGPTVVLSGIGRPRIARLFEWWRNDVGLETPTLSNKQSYLADFFAWAQAQATTRRATLTEGSVTGSRRIILVGGDHATRVYLRSHVAGPIKSYGRDAVSGLVDAVRLSSQHFSDCRWQLIR